MEVQFFDENASKKCVGGESFPVRKPSKATAAGEGPGACKKHAVAAKKAATTMAVQEALVSG